LSLLDHVGIIFPNSLISPEILDEHKFPTQGILIFPNPIGAEEGGNNIFNNNYVETDADIKWTIEGVIISR
jgi:hypothetical protein